MITADSRDRLTTTETGGVVGERGAGEERENESREGGKGIEKIEGRGMERDRRVEGKGRG